MLKIVNTDKILVFLFGKREIYILYLYCKKRLSGKI